MSRIALEPNSSGSGVFTIASPNSNTSRTLNLPDAAGTLDTVQRAGNVLQVMQSTVRTTADITTSNTPAEISTNYRITITPTSASSKIVLMFFGHFVSASTAYMAVAFYRSIGGGAYSKVNTGLSTEAFRNSNAATLFTQSTLMHVDSPNTTSQCIYTPYYWNGLNAASCRVNDNGLGSFMLAMEIAA